MNEIQPEYISELQAALRTPWCVGILGGKVNHAVYYVGYNSRNCFVGLDPHTVLPAMTLADPFPSPDLFQQTHMGDLQETRFSELDPSLTLGFYFKEQDEFDAFCSHYSCKSNKILCCGDTIIDSQLFSVEFTAPDLSSLDLGGTFDGFGDEEDNDSDGDYVLI